MMLNLTKAQRDSYNTSAYYRGVAGEDRSGNDLFATFTYSFEACLIACNKYNELAATDGRKPCIAGTMNFNQLDSVKGQKGANCFLKSEAGSNIDNTNPDAVGFRLCSSSRCVFNDTMLRTPDDVP